MTNELAYFASASVKKKMCFFLTLKTGVKSLKKWWSCSQVPSQQYWIDIYLNIDRQVGRQVADRQAGGREEVGRKQAGSRQVAGGRWQVAGGREEVGRKQAGRLTESGSHVIKNHH